MYRSSFELVRESMESVTRAVDLQALTMDGLWDEVGRVATDGYRQSVIARMGFDAEGEQAVSPKIGGAH